MSANSEIEWKIITVSGYELEAQLNELSSNDHEVFSVQFTGDSWTIISKIFKKKSEGKTVMGFKAPS